MSLADELLDTAWYLLARNGNKPTAADRRRSVSTAYYALFHRLMDPLVSRLLPATDQQALLGRGFDHGRMKTVCQRVSELAQHLRKPTASRPAILPALVAQLATFLGVSAGSLPDELVRVAEVFDLLQQRRHETDYNRAVVVTREDARDLWAQVETAFADLTSVEKTPAGQAFLLLLLIGEPKAR